MKENIFMKRAQSRGVSGFARVLTMLALMLTFVVTGARAQSEWTNIVANSDMEGTDVSCFYVKENAKGAGNMFIAHITAGIGKEIAGNPSRAIRVRSTGTEANTWDTQFFIRLPYELPAGTSYRLSFDYKADQNADADFQCANEPGEYNIWYIGENDTEDFSFTTSWQTFSKEYTVPSVCDGITMSDQGDWLLSFQTIYFSLGLNGVATEYIIDNVKVEVQTSDLAGLTPSPVTDPSLMVAYPPYTATLAEGTEDADNWTITPTEGAYEGETVTATYNGTKKVKNVTSVVKAPAASYSWESPTGTVVQTGGTIAYVNGDGDRLNYLHNGNYTISLNGKKNNLGDETASANAGRMDVTLDNALAAGDVISITGYIYKDESKQSSVYIIFNGTNGFDKNNMSVNAESEVFGDESNTDPAFNGAPKTVTITVPAEAAGCKSFTMTRGQVSNITNLFITKFIINSTADLEVTWNAGTKQASFTMSAADTELQVEYYPAATADKAPAPANGAMVGNSDPLVSAAETASGTPMYLVTTTNTKPTSTEGFGTDVPTAAALTAAGTYYVWYYIAGDAEHNDSEVFGPIAVTVLPDKFNIAFKAANANTIEDGKATVKVGDDAAEVKDGKLEQVKKGSKVTITAKEGYKFRKVEGNGGIVPQQ